MFEAHLALICEVESVQQLGVRCEHALVEVAGEARSSFRNQGKGVPDNIQSLGRETPVLGPHALELARGTQATVRKPNDAWTQHGSDKCRPEVDWVLEPAQTLVIAMVAYVKQVGRIMEVAWPPASLWIEAQAPSDPNPDTQKARLDDLASVHACP